MKDTNPKIERMMIDGMNRMSTAEKIDRVWKLRDLVQGLAYTDMRARYPTASVRELKLRVAALHIPADLMKKAFDWPPRTHRTLKQNELLISIQIITACSNCV